MFAEIFAVGSYSYKKEPEGRPLSNIQYSVLDSTHYALPAMVVIFGALIIRIGFWGSPILQL